MGSETSIRACEFYLVHAENCPSAELPLSLCCSLGDRFEICPQYAPF